MLAYEVHGSGEPLVLVHGVTHRRQAWYPVLDRLTDQRQVFLVDLPGHGQSPDLFTDDRSVEAVLADAFREFLDEVGLDRPHVAGNSLGGRVALEAAVNGHARSVTALSPAGFWQDEREFAYTRRIFKSASALIDVAGSQRDHLATLPAGRHLLYSMLMAHPGKVPADHALGDIRGFQRAHDALHILLDQASPFTGEIPDGVPVTIAWAARDLVLPTWQAKQARAQLPQARHLIVRGVGHVPMWDNPAFVARLLLQGSAPVAKVKPLASARSGRSRSRAASAGRLALA